MTEISEIQKNFICKNVIFIKKICFISNDTLNYVNFCVEFCCKLPTKLDFYLTLINLVKVFSEWIFMDELFVNLLNVVFYYQITLHLLLEAIL